MNEAETELGIFPDIPDSQIKRELDCDDDKDEDTSFDKEIQLEEDYLVDEDDNDNCEVKMEESEDVHYTQLRVKMEVFPDNNYYYAPTKMEVDDENSNAIQPVPRPHETKDQFKVGGVMRHVHVRQREKKVSRKEFQESNQILRCIYCRYVSTSICRNTVVVIKKDMDLHHALNHPDHFFLPEKSQLSGVKRKQFQRIIEDFLFPEFIQKGKVGQVRSCSLCAKKYQILKGSEENDFRMRKHLVLEHKSEMKRRLMAILEDETLEGKLVGCRPEGIWCPCGMYLSGGQRMMPDHKRLHCILTGYGNCEDEDDDDELIKLPVRADSKSSKPLKKNKTRGLKLKLGNLDAPTMTSSCEEVVEEEMGSPKRNFHLQRVDAPCNIYEGATLSSQEIALPLLPLKTEAEEAENVIRNQSEESSSLSNLEVTAMDNDNVTVNSGPSFMANFLPGIAKKLFCKLCMKTLHPSNALAHWKYYCRRGLRLPRNSEDESSKSNCMSANDHYKTEVEKINKIWPFMRRRKLKGIRGTTSSLSCTYCRFVCPAEYSGYRKRIELQLHQVRYHPEHFFPEEKEQVSGVKREQFQRILVGFLFPRFMQRIGDFRSCTLCVKKYQNSNWGQSYVCFRRHLILHHMHELKEKLKVILESKSLEEKLINCGKTEVWCRCGMYLPRGMEIHRTLYCNLTAPHPDKDGDINEERTQASLKLQLEGFTALGKSDQASAADGQGDASSKCSYCSFTSTAVSRAKWNSMEMHLVRFHPEHNFPDERVKAAGLGLKRDEFQKLILGYLCSQFIGVGGRRWICTLCGKKYCTAKVYYRKMVLRKHLISEHNDELKGKLQSVLEEIAEGSTLKNYF